MSKMNGGLAHRFPYHENR